MKISQKYFGNFPSSYLKQNIQNLNQTVIIYVRKSKRQFNPYILANSLNLRLVFLIYKLEFWNVKNALKFPSIHV